MAPSSEPYPWRNIGRLCLRDIGSVVLIGLILLGAHAYVERRPIGAHLEAFEYALLQQALLSDADATLRWHDIDPTVPVVIDISPLRIDKSIPTDRQKLTDLVDALRRMNVAAIGLDIDFSPDDDGRFVTPQDPRLFLKWKDFGNVRVGVFRRDGDLPRRWLGHPEFQVLAAGMMLPGGRPGFATQFSSPDSSLTPVDARPAYEDYLLQMPAALYEVTHPGSRAMLVENPNLSSSDAGGRIGRGQYPIDYSFLNQILKIRYRGVEDVELYQKAMYRRVVLVGDLSDPEDTRCTLAGAESVPGVLIHASALATLNRGIFRYIDSRKSFQYDVYVSLAGLLIICAFRWLGPAVLPLRTLDHHSLEIVVYTFAAFMILVTGVLSIGVSRIFWPDSLWIAAAFFIHPHLKNVVGIFLRGVRGLVLTGAATRRASHVT